METISIGKRIKELRQELDLTQANFADIIGISKAMVSIIEIDKSTPTFETIKKICTSFDVSADYFFGEGEISPKNYLLNKNDNKIIAAKPIDLWGQAGLIKARLRNDLKNNYESLYNIHCDLETISYLSQSLTNFLPTIWNDGVGPISNYQNELPPNHPLKLDYNNYYSKILEHLQSLSGYGAALEKFLYELTNFLAKMQPLDEKSELPSFNPDYWPKKD